VGAAFLVVHLVQPRGLGFGDVRLAALTGALTAYGTASVADAAFAAVLAAVVASIATVARRARATPLAPYLLAASAVAVLVSIRQ
jgi:leader peptidase (prepilin peptidase)/N-methyltransferase